MEASRQCVLVVREVVVLSENSDGVGLQQGFGFKCPSFEILCVSHLIDDI